MLTGRKIFNAIRNNRARFEHVKTHVWTHPKIGPIWCRC